jgi:hypothetical protein
VYSKDEASKIKQAFWTTFGQYISPQPSADGLKINWINYKTGIKHLHFKMDADKRSAMIAIELSHPDLEIQEMFMEHFKPYKALLDEELGENWEWQLHVSGENQKVISRIGTSISGVSVFNQQDWPALISFFKPRIIALDSFWSTAQYGFELFK